MRKTVVTLLYIVGSVSATAQSTQNYVMSQARNTNNALMTTYQYYDGMGRPFEKVQVGVTSTNKNLIWLTDYDGLGRESKEWLPYENSSSYLSGSTVRSSAVTSYSDQKPYLQNVYEASPLNRINEVKEQGQLWHSHPKQIEYLHNTTSYPLSCKDYKVNISGTVSMNGIYGADMLSVKKMTDEDGHITYEFRDKKDRLILQRCMLSTDNSADTYYAYDYRGNLCYVLQPEYQNNADLNLFAFQYKYDSRHNVIEKKLPGADPIKYAYDKANRLIFSQDGVQRQQYCLTFMLYDIHGRLVLKGSSTSVTLPNVSSTFVYANKGTSGGIGTSGYTTNLSLVSPTVEQAHYYDDYTFKVNALGFGNSSFTAGTVSAKGLETGTRIATLQSNPSNYYSVIHYDIKGRNTKTVSTNQLNGTETVTTTYGYTDLPQTVTHVHTASGLSTQTEVMTYTYDQADRELTVTHKLNNNATVTLKNNSYDKYGRLQTCNLMNSETVTYGYNIRSWLTNISSTNFTESLLYFGTPNQCFNGNISRIIWKQNSASTTRGYDFTYDPLNRLTSAVYGESTNLQSNVNRYTTSYTYDKNGNFLTITRNGLKDGSVYGLIDDLTFTYDGNQVTKIEDAAIDPTYNGAFNFNDGASQTDEYVYDKNGNLTKDLNKNILSVQYNSLNLPSRINYVTYTYSAEGERLTSVFNVGTGGYSEIYCGNIMYNNGTLKRILVDGGFITFSGSTPVYHYYLKDHLGSNNVVVNASGTVKQVNNYYPFGGISGESISGSLQTFKYNGKEFDRMNGLDWYDYGARQMSPDIGRFTTMDPMAEKYYSVSPYAYCGNNPIRYNDFWGLEPQQEHIVDGGSLPEVTISSRRKVMQPVSGFWDNLNYFLFGRSYTAKVKTNYLSFNITYSVDRDGYIVGVKPITGEAPVPSRSGLSPSEIKKLLSSGNKLFKNGLTLFGRALKKHGDRTPTKFPKAVGTISAINQQAENVAKKILSDPAIEKNVSSGSFMNSRYGGDVTNYFSSDGRGIRFNKEGDFIGFIEKNIIENE